MKFILFNLLSSLDEILNESNAELLLDIQSSNIWKIIFLSVCLLIILTIVIVLFIKIKNIENKKGDKK